MMVTDPLEDLQRSAQRVKEWADRLVPLAKEMMAEPGELGERVLGETGAVFAHFEELRRQNRRVLAEAVGAERTVREEIDRLFNQMMATLREIVAGRRLRR